ncbi:MAG: HAD family hydrolase [Acidimicrobiia bacterium]|nr:HAD family hydrolase [Acidimicrobiia bacterium]
MTHRSVSVVGLDADDTLWHNETLFRDTQERFHDLVVRYADDDVDIDAQLLAVERRNLDLFGYGVKGFTLSLVETAIEVTRGRVPALEIENILAWGKDMLAHPVELLDGVAEIVHQLAERYRLMIITKGDLLHQETKVARSGLADIVEAVEIVSEKDEPTYGRLFEQHRVDPVTFVMVGNSVASDVLPVIALGARAVHVPFHTTWALEAADAHDSDVYPTLSSIRELPGTLRAFERRS